MRRSGNHHAVAFLHPLDECAYLFDNAHSGVVGNGRLGDVRGAERAADDGVTNRRRLGANQDLARLDGVEPELLHRRAGAVADKGFEAPPGVGSGKLRGSLSGYHWGASAMLPAAAAVACFNIFRREMDICGILQAGSGSQDHIAF